MDQKGLGIDQKGLEIVFLDQKNCFFGGAEIGGGALTSPPLLKIF